MNKIHRVPAIPASGWVTTDCGVSGRQANGSDTEFETADNNRFEATSNGTVAGVTCANCLKSIKRRGIV
jgi:hypothetical protein